VRQRFRISLFKTEAQLTLCDSARNIEQALPKNASRKPQQSRQKGNRIVTIYDEFLKEHCKVTELETTVVQQRKEFESKITHQQKRIEALTAVLQKVSAQLEVNTPTPKTVSNNH
jgi:formate-dependent phosphoribosylglycinamide formyltransferase (GAR transformylase)